MSQLMDLKTIKQTYRHYSGIYDFLFGPVLEPGRRAAIAAAQLKPGQRVLELGVGTGLSLSAYHPGTRVVGIDVCPEMLKKARRRVAQLNLGHVEALIEMNGEQMDFPDHDFDAVVAMYIVGVTPSPERLLAEMRRVCVPGGDIVIVNHFASRHPFIRRFEKAMAPLSAEIGFRTNLDLASIGGIDELDPIDVRNVNLFGYAKLLHFRNRSAASPNGAESLAAEMSAGE
ncbi:MAG TPA: class I SAM-dependent methyltransferase [Alphaproteobacteria bacterium]|nr:class I SAM-dependent methyltransferase [Alphaproteobacteria bacterium]